MLALRVTVPVACFRKGYAREFWETEELPPPATCYGFLLSLVGERDRRRHVGVRVTSGLLRNPARQPPAAPNPERSTVLRTLWRVKENKPPGTGTNLRPDFQELLTDVHLAVWLDSSSEESQGPNLEERVAIALDHPERVERFGGLSLGESTHLVNEVSRIRTDDDRIAHAYLLEPKGRLSLPVWVDHVGSKGTRYAVGDLKPVPVGQQPAAVDLPRIHFL